MNRAAEKRRLVEARKARIGEHLRRIEITSRCLSNDSLHGGVKSRFRGRGMDFDEVREYEPGDDVRAIDWNASARTGRTFVKKYREEKRLTVIFAVDLSASGEFGAGDTTKHDQATEIAAVLALAALRSDHRVGLLLFTDALELFMAPAGGRTHAAKLVRELVTFEPKSRGTNLAAALRVLSDRLPKRTLIVLLSDFLLDAKDAEASTSALRSLASRHDVVAIRMGDAHDRELPSVGLITLEDSETGEVVEVDTQSASQRSRLVAALAETDERIRALARGTRTDLLELDTLRPYLGPLIGFFRARGVRS